MKEYTRKSQTRVKSKGVISAFGRLFIVAGKVDAALGKAISAAKE